MRFSKGTGVVLLLAISILEAYPLLLITIVLGVASVL